MRRHVLKVAVAMLLLATFAGHAAAARAEKKASKPERTEFDVQALVMEMADEYIAGIAEAVYLFAADPRVDSRSRVLFQSFLRNGVGAALDIGTGTNPNVSLLDMLVLSSLQVWAFENNWTKAGIEPAIASRVAARLYQARQEAWDSASRILTQEQRDTLNQLIDAWIKENPERTVVSLVRFSDFTDERRVTVASHRERAHSLLVNLDDVTETVDQARLLGERLVWFAGRYPYVLGEQSELTVYRILDQPEFRQVFTTLDSLNALSKTMSQQLDGLQGELDRQRTEIFRQLDVSRAAAVEDAQGALDKTVDKAIESTFDHIRDERENIFKEFDSRESNILESVRELHATIEASSVLAKELTGTAGAVDQILKRFQEIPDTGGEPIRIPDIRDAATETSEAAKHMTELLVQTNDLLASKQLDKRLAEFDQISANFANRLFLRGLALIAVLMAGIAILRRLPRQR